MRMCNETRQSYKALGHHHLAFHPVQRLQQHNFSINVTNTQPLLPLFSASPSRSLPSSAGALLTAVGAWFAFGWPGRVSTMGPGSAGAAIPVSALGFWYTESSLWSVCVPSPLFEVWASVYVMSSPTLLPHTVTARLVCLCAHVSSKFSSAVRSAAYTVRAMLMSTMMAELHCGGTAELF